MKADPLSTSTNSHAGDAKDKAEAAFGSTGETVDKAVGHGTGAIQDAKEVAGSMLDAATSQRSNE